MRIIAIDDEIIALNYLVSTLKTVRPEEEIVDFQDPDELMEYAKDHPIDIAFLDIRIFDTSGIDIAKKLKSLYPLINVIFVTAYGEYVSDAMRMHASGYLTKPYSVEDVKRELADLRYDVVEEDADPTILTVKCFGNFEVFNKKGDIIKFSRAKSKEAFAYLICRNGASCTIGELVGILFEDEAVDSKKKSYIQKILSVMVKDLETAGVAGVIRKTYNSIAIDAKLIECDYYKYLKDKDDSEIENDGEFMSQYSWAEYFNVFFMD